MIIRIIHITDMSAYQADESAPNFPHVVEQGGEALAVSPVAVERLYCTTLGTYEQIAANLERQAVYDRIYPRIPINWIDEAGAWHSRTPPDRLPGIAGETTLADLAGELQTKIDAAAEFWRQQFVTPGAGQALEYQATQAELDRYAADPAPDPAAYPYLSADIGILGADLAAVVAVVGQLSAAWQQAGSLIKSIRRAGKAAVAAAQSAGDPEAMEAAADLDWSPVEQLLP